jgi:hypothetical protein
MELRVAAVAELGLEIEHELLVAPSPVAVKSPRSEPSSTPVT